MKKLLLAALLASGALGPSLAAEPQPPWLRVGPHTTYDGLTDGLVTGGLGAEAMLGAPPGYADPLHPTAAELRRWPKPTRPVDTLNVETETKNQNDDVVQTFTVNMGAWRKLG